MKPFFRAILIAGLLSALHHSFLSGGYALWNVSFISLSSLIAGILFIMAMIFQSALRDYKQANIAIAEARGSLLNLFDLTNDSAIHKAIIDATNTLKSYIELKDDFVHMQKSLTGLIDAFHNRTTELSGAQERVYLNTVQSIRKNVSYLAFAKDLYFPRGGYYFLYSFLALLLGIQLLAKAESALLGTLFMFSLSFVLVFFAEFIRDLDHPFERNYACFLLDTVPLENAVKVMES